MFAVIWFGTPHSPFKALPEDKAGFGEPRRRRPPIITANWWRWTAASARCESQLRDLGIADNTLLVFCSDNGGLPEIKPDTVGGLRGNKGSPFTRGAFECRASSSGPR